MHDDDNGSKFGGVSVNFDFKGEILFEDGLKVHFKCYRGQRKSTIKYFDESNKEVPYDKIWGKQYEYCKLTNIDGTLLYRDNIISKY